MLRSHKIILLLFAAIVGNAWSADPSPNAIISQIIQPLVTAGQFSGCVAIRQNGKLIGHYEVGLADREKHTANSPKTRFYVASVTKSLTAVAILQLRDRKLLSLDDPISGFLPDFPHGDVTIRQLLTHKSGFAHPVFYRDFYDLATKPYTAAEAVKLFQDRPVAAAPGTKHIYSDYNYVVLARLIEIASATDYSSYIQQNILKPFGLTSATNSDNTLAKTPDLATGYQPVGMRDLAPARHFNRSIDIGAASMSMSDSDLALWTELLGSGKATNQNSSRELLSDNQDGILHFQTVAGHRALHLTGWDNVGFAASSYYFPDEHLSLAITTNENNSGITDFIGTALANALLEKKIETLHFLQKADSASFAGTYRFGDDFYVPGQTMELVFRDGNLMEQQHNPDRLIGLLPVSASEFIHRSSWMRVSFETKKGSPVIMHFGPFVAARVRPIEHVPF